METDDRYLGSMTFGVTTKNPRDIDAAQLPDDSDELLSDKHAFIVCKDVANKPKKGDVLIFSLNEEGTFSDNISTPLFGIAHRSELMNVGSCR